MRTLKEARMKKGLTQTELALMIDKSTQTIRDYEKGAYKIPGDILIKLQEIVGEFKPTRE